MNVLAAALLLVLLHSTQCLRILGVFPPPAKSHYTLASSLMRGLARKGHDVTVISLIGEKNLPKNTSYRDIVVPDVSTVDPKSMDMFALDKMNFITFNLFMNFYGNQLTEMFLNDSKVQELINSNEKFDIVILEQFINDGLKVLAHHFQAPLVLFVTFGSNSWINPLVGNPAPPSYIPEQNIPFDHKNFWDRLHNTIIYVFGQMFRHFIFFPQQEKIMRKYFPNSPSLEVLNYNASLVLLNSHVSANMVVPRVPNMIDIGGLHLKPTQKLPTDLRKFLDEAKEGVVYFSMGSALQSVHLPLEKRQAILRVFGRLKQKVLWKWEDEVLPGQPQNVRLGKWLPQQDILAHPNVKLFITHGGLLSLIESIHHGVPLLALPVFGDQISNSNEIANNNIGRRIIFRNLNEENLEEALTDLLTNPKYQENMKRRSKIMRDRILSPIDEADYWLEYVVKHQGAGHLRVPGLDLVWYQYLLLDVVGFVMGAMLLTLGVLWFVSSLICWSKNKKVKIN